MIYDLYYKPAWYTGLYCKSAWYTAYIINQHDIRAYIINQHNIRAYIINQHDIRDYIINQHDIRDYIINTLKQNTSDILNEYTNQLTNRLKHGTGILSILMRLGKLCTTVTRSEPVHGDIRCGHSPIIVTEHVYWLTCV